MKHADVTGKMVGWGWDGLGTRWGVGRGARDPIHACDQLKIEHCSLILRWVVTMRRTWDYLERTKKTAQKVGQHLEWN